MEKLALSCYGVTICLVDDASAGLCQRLRDTLPPEFVAFSGSEFAEVSYVVTTGTLPETADYPGYRITCNGAEAFTAATEEAIFRWLCQDIDNTVAQRSPQMLFVHAGVVGWRGMAIVIPGRSYTGKSTLVAELVRRGAVYYSDEFAALNDTGKVHPYRRTPVLRNEKQPPHYLRLIREDEPTEPLPIGLIVAGVYQSGTTWRPNIVRGVQAVLPLIDSTVLARQESAKMLRIAARVAPTVVTLQGLRSEAKEVAARLLDLVDDALVSHACDTDKKGSSLLAADLSRVAEFRLRSQTGRPPTDRQLIAARYVRMMDFLSPEEHQRLLEQALAGQADFHESGIIGKKGENQLDFGIRKSRTLSGPRLEELWPMFERRLQSILPAVRKELGISWFRLGEIERQLTVHENGDFFLPHHDIGHPIAANRRISCVYYFHTSPQRFTGGELKLYDSWVTPTDDTGAGTYTTLFPVDNSIVFFPSNIFHEVCPVHCETDAFADGRFSITIWFREEQKSARADNTKAAA